MAPEASWPALDLFFASHPWHGDLSHLPNLLVDRLKHYFLTYKQAPTEAAPACELTRVYGREEAFEVIRRSQDDYMDRFGETLGPLLAKG